MKDPHDGRTTDLLAIKTKAQRFREKQLKAGRRQFSYWLSEEEAEQIKQKIKEWRGDDGRQD